MSSIMRWTTALVCSAVFSISPFLAAVPPGWTSQDIGAVGIAGSFSQTDGVYSISGSGADIWGASDEFHFAHRGLTGDGGMIARITALTNPHDWAKVGLMIREDISPSSKHAMCIKMPDPSGYGVALQYREATGGQSGNQQMSYLNTPRWLKIERVGNMITGFHASDVSGAPGSWIQIGQIPVAMVPEVRIGLMATSHDNSRIVTAHFDHVSFFGGAVGDLVGHWPFDGDGVAVLGENGALHGPVPASGANGLASNGLRFAGASHRVEVPHYALLDGEAFSIMAWARLESLDAPAGVISRTGATVGGALGVAWDLQVLEDGRLQLTLNKGDQTLSARSVPAAVSQDRWVHLAATYDGARSQPRLYVDGLEVTDAIEGADGFGAPDLSQAASGALFFGSRVGVDPIEGLMGGLDDGRVYVIALDLQGVRAAMAEATPAVPPSWPPEVTLIVPRDGQPFLADSPLTLRAFAEDPDGGTINRVEFFVDGTLAGMASTDDGAGVFSFLWTPGANDAYAVRVRAVDNDTPPRETWTDAVEIRRADDMESGTVIINEIHYDPDVSTQQVEFVELHNPGLIDVDLSGWAFTSGIGYTFPDGTILSAGGYVVVCEDVAQVGAHFMVPAYLLYGPFEGKLSNDGERVRISDANGDVVDEVTYALGFPWPVVGDPLTPYQPGTGGSIQLVNPLIDKSQGSAWRSAPPTPGSENTAVFTFTPPPMIDQIQHTPRQPVSNEAVAVTALVTDPVGVGAVTLLYQIVEPGAFIMRSDPEYGTKWVELEMSDDGQNGDAVAGDGIYTAIVPADIQRHRRLIRYRVRFSNGNGQERTAPFADDPQPNFAWFCYDGVPAWEGSIRPGVEPVIPYTPETLTSVPVYHLISKKSEIEKSTWLDHYMGNDYLYQGAFVYDGHVYDHILFRSRGGTWRYAMRKNMWKFRFNRGHYFQAYDAYGNPYPEKWNRVNLGANIQQANFGYRGEQGMFESVGFRLFELAGLESPGTHPVHFRIIDETNEDGRLNAAHGPMTSTGTQYDGDFWGMYLAVEQMDRRFIKSRDMPDGNLYKMEGGTGELKADNPLGPTDKSDLNAFMQGYRSNPTATWWRENVDLERYYNYRAIVECIHHYDIADGKNYYFFNDPEQNRWITLPWDLDLTWANNMYGSGEEPFKANGLLSRPALAIEYRNRMREIRDLLYNPDQCGQLLDEYAAMIWNPEGQSMVDADRAMWDYHWVMTDQAYYAGYSNRPPGDNRAGQGRFYQIAPTKDFPGMVQLMKDYVVSRGTWIDSTILADGSIPHKPVISAVGAPDFPLNDLSFQSSAFSDPQGAHTFAAMKWRIAEVSDGSPTPAVIETLLGTQGVWKYFKGTQEPSVPMSAWRAPDFDDSAWDSGPAPIGWGEPDPFLGTTLDGMANTYTTFYMRKTFTVADPTAYADLLARVIFDDGFNMWINGFLVAQRNSPAENLAYFGTASAYNDAEMEWHDIALTPGDYLVAGVNTIAIQVLNRNAASSDCFMDVALLAQVASDPNGPGAPRRGPGVYEINPVWESDEITTFADTITIPPQGLEPGRVYRVRARMKDDTGRWSHWSDAIQFVAGDLGESPLRQNLRVTEVHYNPFPPPLGSLFGAQDFEFIELKNVGAETLDLSYLAFDDGIQFTFPEGSLLEAGAFALVVKNLAAFEERYGTGFPIYGAFDGQLSNSGERIRLTHDPWGLVFQFTYSDGRGWPQAPDGAGHSLVPLPEYRDRVTLGALDYGRAWRPSVFIGGSPAAEDPDPPVGPVINEFMAHTNDWIELYNPLDVPMTLTDYFLSDTLGSPAMWPIPEVTIGPRQWLSFVEVDDFNFGLSKFGEYVILSHLPGDGQDRVVDSIVFAGQLITHTKGRYPDGAEWLYPMRPTRDGANALPDTRVVIDEVMYHPTTTTVHLEENLTAEYVELYNATWSAIPLWNPSGTWRISGGIEFQFPPDVVLPPHERLLVVNFDPADGEMLDFFRQAYGIDDDAVVILGPYRGALSNRGDRISLEKPEPPELSGEPVVPGVWAIVDEVIYFDQWPWPPEADGEGYGLQRLSPQRAGSDPDNWQAAPPTPGAGDRPDGMKPVSGWVVF